MTPYDKQLLDDFLHEELPEYLDSFHNEDMDHTNRVEMHIFSRSIELMAGSGLPASEVLRYCKMKMKEVTD